MLMGLKSANVVGPLGFSSMQYLSSYNFKNSTYTLSVRITVNSIFVCILNHIDTFLSYTLIYRIVQMKMAGLQSSSSLLSNANEKG